MAEEGLESKEIEEGIEEQKELDDDGDSKELGLPWLVPPATSPTIHAAVNHSSGNLTEGKVRERTAEAVGLIWDMLPVTEKTKDEIDFSKVPEGAKINQFPAVYNLGRKDCLWKNYSKMRERHGREHFDFLPRTYVLPEDAEELKDVMRNSDRPMIVKPPNWYCGIGIKLINKIEEIPNKKTKMCVQEYISNPLLINGCKFDLRLYVLLTGVDPLKIYLYKEGLVRFATQQYTNDPSQLGNNFIHLTNYSVNKENKEGFVHAEVPGEFEGHKWNLGSLWRYLDEKGIDWRPVWEMIGELCACTIIAAVSHIRDKFQADLFGFDVFIDANLKPWLLEVNNLPSLFPEPIDRFVNDPMIAELLNIVGLQVPHFVASKHRRLLRGLGLSNEEAIGHDPKLFSRQMTDKDIAKEESWKRGGDILEDFGPEDVRTLLRAEEELCQCQKWERIFPTSDSLLHHLLPDPGYRDVLLDAWEKPGQKDLRLLKHLCSIFHREGVHLEVPAPDVIEGRQHKMEVWESREQQREAKEREERQARELARISREIERLKKDIGP